MLGEDPTRACPCYKMVASVGMSNGETEEQSKATSEKCPRGLKPDQLDFDVAFLCRLPRTVGEHGLWVSRLWPLRPYGAFSNAEKKPKHSRQGPTKVLTIDVPDAVALLEKPKGRKGAEVLKEMGKDPTTNKDIRLMDGRYGPYVTDGDTNASLGKTVSQEELTLELAVELIRKREAAPKRKGRYKKKKK